MITLIRGIEKECIFTLCEKTTLTSPFYVFNFISSEITDDTIVFTATDLSTAKNRYNQFNLLAGNGVVTGATFDIAVGTYDYIIYESTGATVSISAATSIVESGLIKIEDPASATTITQYTPIQTNYTYEG